jgi:hypothetical protein
MGCIAYAAPKKVEPSSTPQYTSDLTEWPNKVSSANSDQWIADNHDKIKKMKPRLLFLNFSNGFSQEKAEVMAKQLCAAATESTRYHGYKDKTAKPFIEYQMLKVVDLTDPQPLPKTPDGNSTKYPRGVRKNAPNMAYSKLYSQAFAKNYGFKDPNDPSRYLRLDELVNRGIVHELWFFAYQRDAGAPFECTEIKPMYDEKFKKIPDEYRHAGNDEDSDLPWMGRSLRVNFVNSERGIGCNIESLSHSFEGMAHANVIPYFRKYFYEYAGFDFDKRWNLPFNSFYELWGEGKGVDYPDEHTAIVRDGKNTYKLDNYYVIGGNVHFTPSGRGHYDLDNMETVTSTIEHYRLFDGPGGKDKAEPWTAEKYQQYTDLAPDCMGRWLIYWRQNVPGYHSPCKDDNGKQMKNWWPFLYY